MGPVEIYGTDRESVCHPAAPGQVSDAPIPKASRIARSALQLQADQTLDLIAREKDKGNDFYRQKRCVHAVQRFEANVASQVVS
eukprot:SAG31_NODE_2666_length_5273_cov_2.404716_6_plen_84_part_00